MLVDYQKPRSTLVFVLRGFTFNEKLINTLVS